MSNFNFNFMAHFNKVNCKCISCLLVVFHEKFFRTFSGHVLGHCQQEMLLLNIVLNNCSQVPNRNKTCTSTNSNSREGRWNLEFPCGRQKTRKWVAVYGLRACSVYIHFPKCILSGYILVVFCNNLFTQMQITFNNLLRVASTPAFYVLIETRGS